MFPIKENYYSLSFGGDHSFRPVKVWILGSDDGSDLVEEREEKKKKSFPRQFFLFGARYLLDSLIW